MKLEMSENEPIRLSVVEHGYSIYLKTKFIESKLSSGINVHHKSLKFASNKDAFNSNMNILSEGCTLYAEDDSEYCLISDNYFINLDIGEELTYFMIWGDLDVLNEVTLKWSQYFKPHLSSPTLEWHYLNSGRQEREVVKLNIECQPCDEMYPFLKDETLKEYYNRYNRSSASILILQGPPGTGKTTFIRGLLSHLNKSAIITYDENIIKNDSIFMDFITGDIDYMIFEDADAFLSSRNEGNQTMHRFLNVGDGLVSRPNKKLIFTTNLETLQDIDSALTREGRCFDILEFSPLTKDQANHFLNSQNMDIQVENEVTIAEIFNSKKYKKDKKIARKTGFIK